MLLLGGSWAEEEEGRVARDRRQRAARERKHCAAGLGASDPTDCTSAVAAPVAAPVAAVAGPGRVEEGDGVQHLIRSL